MLKLILYFVSVFVGIESAKILGVFPIPSVSHQVVYRPLMLELAKRGHEVTVITTDPAYPKGRAPYNLTEIDLHDISYEHWNKFMIEEGSKEKDAFNLLKSMSLMFTKLVAKQFNSEEVQDFVKRNDKIDLIFLEASVLSGLYFSHVYKAPVIEISSLGGVYPTYEMVGAATNPLRYPDATLKKIYNLTLHDKMSHLMYCYSFKKIFLEYATNRKLINEIFGSEVPNLLELRKNVHMVFLNVHPLWDLNRPVPPNVVYLGGLHLKPQRDLPKDLKSYLDSSKNGVIYMSFGTNVKPSWIPLEKTKMFNKVFSQLPYDVLWKWDNDELLGRAENVKLLKWLPQSDLLRHPKIKLFITQAGLQSTDEAITAGVPLIGIPMLGDQWFNAEQYVKFNIGKNLDLGTMTEEQLMETIRTVTEDESYRQNIIKLRDIMNDQPQSPLERAVWWTEHVLRHGGGAHLRAPAAHMSWAEYYELELVLILLTGFVVFAAVIVLAIYFVLSKLKYYVGGKVKTN